MVELKSFTFRDIKGANIKAKKGQVQLEQKYKTYSLFKEIYPESQNEHFDFSMFRNGKSFLPLQDHAIKALIQMVAENDYKILSKCRPLPLRRD